MSSSSFPSYDGHGVPHNRCYRTGPIWRPLGDHTLCAIVNDLRVYERLTRAHVGHTRGDQGIRAAAIYWGSSAAEGRPPARNRLVRRYEGLGWGLDHM